MNRWHMEKAGLMVEHHSRGTLEQIRRIDSRFKGARIRDVVQMCPDLIKPGFVYLCGVTPPERAASYICQPDGHMMLCNADGSRSIFDDVDE